jgi:hypothetical protein
VDYSVYEGKPAIQFLTVAQAMRRRGFATRLVCALQREFPAREIEWGFASDEGEALRASLPTTDVVDFYVGAATRRLRILREQRDVLLSSAGQFHALENPSAYQRAAYEADMRPLNDLHDAIAVLEDGLYGAKPRITLIDVERIDATFAARDALTRPAPAASLAPRRITA